jgi:hypothetical protein
MRAVFLAVLLCVTGSLAAVPTAAEVDAVRASLAEARKALNGSGGVLQAEQRQRLRQRLQRADEAFQRYVQLSSDSDKREDATAPLLAAGALLLADDASVVGAADDVLLPFIGIALLVTQLKASSPAATTELETAWRDVLTELDSLGRDATHLSAALGYIPPPATLPAFPNAKSAKPKTPVPNSQGKLRKRWVDAGKGWIFEWDYQHGTVEKYDQRGKHLGEFDPKTGQQTKPADPNRSIRP